MNTNIKIDGFKIISRNLSTVFQYVANLENDQFWRKEINSTSMNAKPQINTLAVEDSFLSKKVPHHILNLICTEYIEENKIIYQTVPDSPFFLKSIRIVEAISEQETKFLYHIEFDKNIVKHGLGFMLPAFIIRYVAKQDMKKYLNKLKTILETPH
ncbi:hypothetical protein AD998_14045 [bacterium 336/3]|nr:hypothetical protein AD998_14045 [bacterium 336/3]